MVLKLYTNAGNFRAFKILIAAEYNGVDIQVPDFDLAKQGKAADFLAKSPAGKVPVLETPQGSIFESNAIARYVARIRRDTELYGATFYESALVDSWVDFTSHEIELPATLWFYPVIGYLPHNGAAVEKAKTDLAKALKTLDSYLVDKTYLVGDKVTLADITVASALVYPYKIVISPEYRAKFPNVLRWFTTCVNQPQFKAVIGDVVLATAELQPSGTPVAIIQAGKGGKGKGPADGGKKEKKEKAPKEKKEKEKPKEQPKKAAEPDPEEEIAKEEKKKANEHPLKVLDATHPSPFVMDTWKKTYSNCSTYDEAMAEFWNTFDSEGWSLWLCDYQYNHELSKLFMTCNLVSGFVQRTDEIRKWAFGVMWITGKDSPGADGMYISGAWLFRGPSADAIKNCNPDAEYYTWTKIETPVSDADKAKLKEYWCSETTVAGRPILDCKVFK